MTRTPQETSRIVRAPRQFLEPDHRDQRGHLEDIDILVAKRGQHRAHDLRQDHQAHRRPGLQPQAAGGLALAHLDRLQSRPENLRGEGAVRNRQAHKAGHEDAKLQSGQRRKPVIDPEDHHQKRDRAEELDIDPAGPLDPSPFRDAHQRHQKPDDQRDQHGQRRDRDRRPEPFQQKGQVGLPARIRRRQDIPGKGVSPARSDRTPREQGQHPGKERRQPPAPRGFA